MLRGDNFVHGPQDSNWKWWVAFQQTPLIGPRRIQRLLDCFGEDLEAAWRAPASQLAAAVGDQIATRIVTTRESLDLDGIVAKLTALGLTVIAFDDSRYPQLLKETDAPPLVLYLLGTILPEDDLSIAVVGSRESTPYGREVAREISKDLAAGGVTVVSGLARGIDGVAHEASLAAGGRSIAVLAGWITTEVGRQPFTVYGLLRTAESASPLAAPAVASSLIAFIIVYFTVFTAGMIYLLRLMAAPPHPREQGPSHDVPIRTAGITPAAGAAAEGAAR